MREQQRYLEPGWFSRNILNRCVRRLTRLGFSVWGSRELRVRGRKSGQWRTTPINLLTLGARHYLVAPRGVTQWVRNVRAAGGGELRVGRRIEAFHAEEVRDDVTGPILRAYLHRWKFEVGMLFEGLDADVSDEQLAKVGSGFPVFRVTDAT